MDCMAWHGVHVWIAWTYCMDVWHGRMAWIYARPHPTATPTGSQCIPTTTHCLPPTQRHPNSILTASQWDPTAPRRHPTSPTPTPWRPIRVAWIKASRHQGFKASSRKNRGSDRHVTVQVVTDLQRRFLGKELCTVHGVWCTGGCSANGYVRCQQPAGAPARLFFSSEDLRV